MKETPRHHLSRAIARIGANRTLLIVGAIFLVALTVRLYRLDGQGLECDEFYTIPAATGHQYVYLHADANTAAANLPLTTSGYKELLKAESGVGLGSVRAVLTRNVHLPLYFFFMHYWIEAFGRSEWTLRLPSAIFGALAAVMIFLLGQELFGLFVGLVSAAFMALAPEQIYFSQQARMYPLLVLLAISSTYALVLGKKHSQQKWPYILYACLSIAGLYTHYEYFFFFAVQVAFVAVGSRLGRDQKKRWLLSQLAVCLAFAPWVLTTISQKKTSPEIVAWVSGSLSGNLILTDTLTKLARLISVPELPLGWLSVIATFVLLIVGAVALKSHRSHLFLLCSWIAFPIAGILLMDQLLGTRAIGITRYWLIIGPPLYLLIGLGIERLNIRAAQIILSAVLAGFLFAAALLTARGELRPKPDRHRELAEFVDSQVADAQQELVLTDGLNSLPLVLAYYGHREMDVLRYKWMVDQLGARSFDQLTGGREEIWLLTSGPTEAVRMLEQNGYKLEEKPHTFGHVAVAKYVRPAGADRANY